VHTSAGQPLPALPVGQCGAEIAVYAMTLIAVLVVGVLLPAVWSGKPARRSAARAVLEILLRLVEAFRRS
jgi:hypothetical protein